MKPENHKGFTKDDVEIAVKWVQALGIKLNKYPEPSFTSYGEGDGYIDLSLKTTAKSVYRTLKKNPELLLDKDWASSWHWTTSRFTLKDGRPGYIVVSYDSSAYLSAHIRIFSHVPDGRHLM